MNIRWDKSKTLLAGRDLCHATWSVAAGAEASIVLPVAAGRIELLTKALLNAGMVTVG